MNMFTVILVSGVVTVTYYFQFYDNGQNIKDETAKVHQEMTSVESKIKETKKNIQDAVNFDYSVKKLGKQLEYFYEYIPRGLTNRHMFAVLTDLMKKTGMTTLSMQGSGTQKKTDLYDAVTVKITAEGKFSQFLSFLSLLTDLDQIISVGNVNIRPVNQRDSKSSGMITTNFDVLGFRYSVPTAPQNKTSEKNKQT